MKWTNEAEEAAKRIPFFVRKKAKKKIEAFCRDRGGERVDIKDVIEAKKNVLSSMKKDIKGFQADTCFGASGCAHRANPCDRLMEKAEYVLKEENILDFLREHVKGDLRYHHEFRLSSADCPNACSQPQIKDFGVIGAVRPGLSDNTCTLCSACVEACGESAIFLGETAPEINFDACLMCGKCIDACPEAVIEESKRGFRIQLGGRLGRHPRLAMELPAIFSEDETIEILKKVLKFYKKRSTGGQRFSKILKENDLNKIYGETCCGNHK